jgi:hypothetical protein
MSGVIGGRVVSFLHHPIFSAQSQVKSSQVKSGCLCRIPTGTLSCVCPGSPGVFELEHVPSKKTVRAAKTESAAIGKPPEKRSSLTTVPSLVVSTLEPRFRPNNNSRRYE